jgi:hypothetical protein
LGTLQLRIPKLRSGPAYFPPVLEARKTSERALVAVIQEAWIGGVSMRLGTAPPSLPCKQGSAGAIGRLQLPRR